MREATNRWRVRLEGVYDCRNTSQQIVERATAIKAARHVLPRPLRSIGGLFQFSVNVVATSPLEVPLHNHAKAHVHPFRVKLRFPNQRGTTCSTNNALKFNPSILRFFDDI